MKKTFLLGWVIFFLVAGFTTVGAKEKLKKTEKKKGGAMEEKVVKTDAEWKKTLTPEQFEILRKKGTERPFTGKYWKSHEKGVYVCAACGFKLFVSDDKFDSGCGWPSFSKPVNEKAVANQEDNTFGMNRTEVMCPRCGGHLGHVFEDGPKPTGLRYCINSASIEFKPEETKKK